MSETHIYPVTTEFKSRAYIDEEKYKAMYARSIEDPEGFWADQAHELVDWFKPWDKVWEWDYHTADVKFYLGAKLNVAQSVYRHEVGRSRTTWRASAAASSSPSASNTSMRLTTKIMRPERPVF